MNRLAKLALKIGRASAERELKWMKQSRPDRSSLLDMLDRRLCGEPLQYILGDTPFGPLDIITRPPTLIPRPETEDWALRLARITPTRPVRVLDLCTGSGCIPLLLCHLWPPGSTRAVGVDISPDAIRLATDNTVRSRHQPITPSDNNPRHPQNTFTPILADINDPDMLHRLDPEPPFDVITANPPYIPLRVYHALPSSVKDYEDPRALIGDYPDAPIQDGLSFYRSIAALLARKDVLAENAIIALEVGHDQAHAVKHLLSHTPGLRIAHIDIWRDPWNQERVIFARVSCSRLSDRHPASQHLQVT